MFIRIFIKKIFFIQFLFFFNSYASDAVLSKFKEVTKELEKINNVKYLIQDCSVFDESENLFCDTLSFFSEKGVPRKPLKHALTFFFSNQDTFRNQRYISIADYSQSSTEKRFYLLDLEKLEVSKYKVSHGSGYRDGIKYGDPDHDGFIDKCKIDGSRTNMTRPGFFKTAELYLSKGTNSSHLEVQDSNGLVVKGWPYLDDNQNANALRLDGLSPGINNHARDNGVVMHGAWYNNKEVTQSDIMGRSYGCPAFSTEGAQAVIPKIQGGSLYYSYVPKCNEDQTKIERDLATVQSTCFY